MRYANRRYCHNIDSTLKTEGKYGIPVITPERYSPCDWIGFNSVLTAKSYDKGVHFFIDDYQFERIYHNWSKYGEILARFEAVMTPDFSMYTDWPVAVQIYNHYRKHVIGATMQREGLRVYPTICWSDKSSYEWCFSGEPKGGCVAVSSVGTQKSAQSQLNFIMGFNEMIKRLQPETVIFYGQIPEQCKANIIRVKPFHDKFTEAKIG